MFLILAKFISQYITSFNTFSTVVSIHLSISFFPFSENCGPFPRPKYSCIFALCWQCFTPCFWVEYGNPNIATCAQELRLFFTIPCSPLGSGCQFTLTAFTHYWLTYKILKQICDKFYFSQGPKTRF